MDSATAESASNPVTLTISDRQWLQEISSPVLDEEPQRDWTFGFITGHRTRVVLALAFAMVGLYVFQDFAWHQGSTIGRSDLQRVWSFGGLLWCVIAIPGLLGLFGTLAYRYPDPKTLDAVTPIDYPVCWRIVSYGKNIDALKATIAACQKEMAKTPLFRYVIEVVCEYETRLDLLPVDDGITYIVVPKSYKTPNESKFKARALQYALKHSLISDEVWLIHLDEETHPTMSGIKGICNMIREEELSGLLRVGQGAILYHRTWKEHPILTLADTIRTGDDFARFYLQQQFGRTIFGMHGSYIVVRNDVEKKAGFDFGPKGSITEDAFWALVLMQSGVRSRWIEGYLCEQSTKSVKDFIKQRSRWYQGLVKVSLYAPVKLRWRICLGLNTIMWTVAPLATVYTLAHFIYGGAIPTDIRLVSNTSFASFVVMYITGLKANMDEHGITGWRRRAGLTTAQIVLMPFLSLLESAGVIYGIITSSDKFDVVKKLDNVRKHRSHKDHGRAECAEIGLHKRPFPCKPFAQLSMVIFIIYVNKSRRIPTKLLKPECVGMFTHALLLHRAQLAIVRA